MKYSVLQRKYVVNESTGEMIGYIADLELDSRSLCIECIIVKEPKGFLQRLRCLFINESRIVIPIDQILNIGKDVIIVKLR